MNIAAVMAALDVSGLDHYAKVAVVMVACRADRVTGCARVSLPRVAKDMECHYDTARRALRRAVDAGYLTVDNSPGRASTWRVNLAVQDRGVPRGLTADTPRSWTADTPRSRTATKESLEKDKDLRARFYPGTGWVQPIANGRVHN